MSQDLTKGDIGSHIKTIAIPAIVGYFFHTMFNVTDTFFAGEISTIALSALTLSFSIFFMIIAIATGMASAITSMVGNALGENNKDKASNIVLNGYIFGLILSIILTIVGFIIAPMLVAYLGAYGEYLEQTLAYINIIIIGSVFFIFAFFTNASLQALGDTKSFRNALIVAAVVNIFLNYWFINGGLGVPPMGVSGIALATIVVEFGTVSYLFYRLKNKDFLNFSNFSFEKDIIKEILVLGFPQSVNMVLMALGIYIITYFAAPFGKEVVAAFGVGMRIEQIVLMPCIGINIAVLAMVSQNNGAKQIDRIKETLKVALRYGTYVSVFGIVVLLVFSQFMMDIFSDDAVVISEGIKYLYVEALVIYPFMIIFVMLAFLTGIKKPNFILYLSVFRQVLAPVVVLSLFSFMGLGVISLWLGIAGIVIFSAYLSWWYAHKQLDNLISSKETQKD